MLNRRELLSSLAATAAAAALPTRAAALERSVGLLPRPLRSASGTVDWAAVRDLFPLRRDWTHFASFLLVSHPKPVADAIARYRDKLDADPVWLEEAAFNPAEGKPFSAAKKALADYVGGDVEEMCLTSNTTGAIAMAFHGLKIRANQEILVTAHDHYAMHETVRFAAARSQATVRRVAMYDSGETANADQMVDRIAKAIRPNTRAIGVTWVHSSTGVKTPVARIAQAVANANRGRASADRCLLIVDGVHGFAAHDVDVAKLGADFFASGCHKWLFAPRGTGFLWGRSDVWTHMRPTIATFDPDHFETWDAWMKGDTTQPMKAAYASPGGFLAFEHVLAVKAAVDLHREIGRDNIAARIVELNAQVREGLAKMPKVTLHTPRDASISAGLSAFEVAGLQAAQVTHALAEKKFRSSDSPYRPSYARVSAGVMNNPQEVDSVLAAIRAL